MSFDNIEQQHFFFFILIELTLAVACSVTAVPRSDW